MKMFNGTNQSGKKFEVIDEENQVIGAFDHLADALKHAQSAPWNAGQCNIRKDDRSPVLGLAGLFRSGAIYA